MWDRLKFLMIGFVTPWVVRKLRGKETAPPEQDGKTPTTEEGLRLRKIYGTVWVKAPPLIAFKKMGMVPIRSKGGKK